MRYMLSSDSSNRVAAEFLRLWGIGKPPNKHETTHLRRDGNGWYLQFVCTNALLATTVFRWVYPFLAYISRWKGLCIIRRLMQ